VTHVTKSRVLRGDPAAETNVRTIERPIVPYMATHGFFGEARNERDRAGRPWEISGVTTQKTMEAYYRKLAEGMGRGEAMQAMQLEMLRSEEHGHPKDWAAFIVSGDDTPMVFPAGEEPREAGPHRGAPLPLPRSLITVAIPRGDLARVAGRGPRSRTGGDEPFVDIAISFAAEHVRVGVPRRQGQAAPAARRTILMLIASSHFVNDHSS
jgi:hypothetical protein